MSTPPPAEAHQEPERRLGDRARAVGAIAWSGFLAAAFATMLCFAFLDPQALSRGDPPEWWASRLHVYAIGFFFFWLTGLIAAAFCWQLSANVRRNGRRDE
jgi:hypothetical protein